MISAASRPAAFTTASLRQAMSIGTTPASPDDTFMSPTSFLPLRRGKLHGELPVAPGSVSVSPSSCTSRQNGPMLTHRSTALARRASRGSFVVGAAVLRLEMARPARCSAGPACRDRVAETACNSFVAASASLANGVPTL